MKLASLIVILSSTFCSASIHIFINNDENDVVEQGLATANSYLGYLLQKGVVKYYSKNNNSICVELEYPCSEERHRDALEKSDHTGNLMVKFVDQPCK